MRIGRKIGSALIGGLTGFSVGIMAPIVGCTAGSYYVGQQCAKLVASEQEEFIAMMFGVPGLCVGCFIEGLLILSGAGAVCLLTSGAICAVIGGSLMVKLD